MSKSCQDYLISSFPIMLEPILQSSLKAEQDNLFMKVTDVVLLCNNLL
jgi:hypothetical protein